jgi:protein-S-isoprenylcysteine O-methyltransferase Ste14
MLLNVIGGEPMSFRKLRVTLLRAVLGIFVVLALVMGQSRPESIWADFAFRWGGYFLLLAGTGLRLWSILYVGSRKSRVLVTHGPYSLCRNPLYLGTTLVVLGTALCFENIPMCAYALGVVIPVHLLVVSLEERHLGAIFGDEYRQYCRTTPRLVPRFAGFHQEDQMTVEVSSLRRAAIDALGVLIIPPAGQLVEILQHAKVLPVLWQI